MSSLMAASNNLDLRPATAGEPSSAMGGMHDGGAMGMAAAAHRNSDRLDHDHDLIKQVRSVCVGGGGGGGRG